MNRIRVAALLLTAFGLSAGDADACLLCRMFGGYGPYGTAPVGSAFYGPTTYTAGYGGGFYGRGSYLGPTPGQVRRANRRAFRRDLFGVPSSYGYFPSYGYSAGYAPATYTAPATYNAGGCSDCGTTIVNSPVTTPVYEAPVYSAPQSDCGCSSGGVSSYVYPETVVPSGGCPGGDCGANFSPSINPIPSESYSTPTYSNESYSSGNPPPLPAGADLIYDGPTENAPGNHSRGTISDPPYNPGGTRTPDRTFEQPPAGGTNDGAFGPRTDGGSATPDPDRGFEGFDEPMRETNPRGNGYDDRGGDGGFNSGEGLDSFKPNEDLNPATSAGPSESADPVERPVQPKRSRDDAAGLPPATLNLADRPVDSGIQIARSRLRVRARYGLPSQVARRYDLEQGRYGDTRRVAAKP